MDTDNIEVKECPYCGETEFATGRQLAQGSILPTKGLLKGVLSKGTSMYHTICLNCGSVVRTYVEEIDIFK